MKDEAMAVHRYAFDFSDVDRSESDLPERTWAQGSQPIPVEAEDVMHARHVGEQVWHRVVAAGMTTNGYECACTRVLEYSLTETRPQANRGTPCTDGCFSPSEQRKFVPEVAGTWRHYLDGPHKEKK